MPQPDPIIKRDAAILLAIVALTLAAYVPAFQAGFIWDDDAYVTQNTLLRSTDGLRRIWFSAESPQYYPLVFTSFWVEYRLWGLEPAGYHVVNVLLHGLNAAFVGLILRRLRVPGGLWVALLFALHPVHVESVAWVTERKNVLSALFYLAAFLSYLRFDETGRRRHYAGALALFVAALFSKTVTASLPVVLALALLYRRRLRIADAWRLLPFFVVALGLSAITVGVESSIIDPVAHDFTLSPFQRLPIACRALGFYAWKLVLPYPLIFNYPRWPVETWSWPAYWPVLPALAALVVLGWLWRRGRRGVAAALAFFVVTLFPALGFIDVYPFRYSFVADHFQYLASLGPLILLVQAGRWLGRRRPLPGVWRFAAGLVLVALLGTMTWRQSRAYRDAETLWRDTLDKHGGSWLANHNLGLVLLERGETQSALTHFERAIAAEGDSAESFTARGMARARLEQPDAALADFDRALELSPEYAQAFIQRGMLRVKLGRFEEALRDLDAVLRANPDHLPALQARGVALLALDRPDRAVVDFTRAIALKAGSQARLDRGSAYFMLGRYGEAMDDFNAVIEENPRAFDAVHNRGMVHARQDRMERALQDFTRVIDNEPTAVKSYLARGRIYFESYNDAARACADWARACELGQCREFNSRCGSRASISRSRGASARRRSRSPWASRTASHLRARRFSGRSRASGGPAGRRCGWSSA